ncbi:MAG: DUF2480 family protein [Crocinitomicaceae bacterium]|nr:DUF2480 family protein [Crocinitomicaceae bacterium]
MADEIINKVAQAQIEQIDLMDFVSKEPLLTIDLKDLLWNEMVLREKDFRDWVKDHDWDQYSDKFVFVWCSNDAIIPAWAYMLVTTHLAKSKEIIFGNEKQAREELFFKNLASWNIVHLNDKRVMVKGCSTIPNPNKAYVELTKKLIPVVKSLMFGEPCSAVPVYKKK